MSTTTKDLARIFAMPERPEPDIPEWLVRPLALHDLDECECGEGDGPCVAGLWDEAIIDTSEARERLGK